MAWDPGHRSGARVHHSCPSAAVLGVGGKGPQQCLSRPPPSALACSSLGRWPSRSVPPGQAGMAPFVPVVLQSHGITAIRTPAMSAKAQP